MLALLSSADGVTLRVKVSPRASRSAILGIHDGALKVSLTAPPVDGAANAALCTLLADTLDLPKRAIEITHGHEARLKTVRITGLSESDVRGRLERA